MEPNRRVRGQALAEVDRLTASPNATPDGELPGLPAQHRLTDPLARGER